MKLRILPLLLLVLPGLAACATTGSEPSLAAVPLPNTQEETLPEKLLAPAVHK